jgi:Gluconate 2-dehydrogenase subunit 3
MSRPDLPRLDRRTAIKWMLAAAASAAVLGPPSFAAPGAATPSGKPYGTDPDLTRDYQPGDLWPLTLSDAQRRTAAALCAAIIPADDQSPSAASVGVHDFIDEWISAPYPDQQKDRAPILDGLAWIDAEARRRFGRDFADLDGKQTALILDDICHLPDARPELVDAAKFFAKFRDLTAGGFYSTPAGMKDLKYIGNTPLAEFKGPPLEVLQKLGLA